MSKQSELYSDYQIETEAELSKAASALGRKISSGDLNAQQARQGWTMDDLKKAINIHGL